MTTCVVQSTKRKRDESQPRHKWSSSEVMDVLEYIKNSMQKGYELEKPTAGKYYKRLLQHCVLPPSVNETKVGSFVRNTKEKYKSAVLWRDDTGQGVMETDGESTLHDILEKKCPHFDFCSEIWGSRTNIHLLFNQENSQIGAQTSELGVVEESQESNEVDVQLSQNSDIILDDDPPVTQTPASSSSSTHKVLKKRKICNFEQQLASKSLKTSKDVIEQGLAQRAEAAKEKCQVEREKMENDTKLAREKMVLEDRKFSMQLEFEKKKHEDTKKLAMKKLKMEKKLELKKLEIRHEEIKLELAKQKGKQ